MEGWPYFFPKFNFSCQHSALRGCVAFCFCMAQFPSWTIGNGGFLDGHRCHLRPGQVAAVVSQKGVAATFVNDPQTDVFF
jgi:hypothetical protein